MESVKTVNEIEVPSADRYVEAFRKIGNRSESRMRMLQFHYGAPERTVTAVRLAEWMGYGHYSAANLHYGRLGGELGDLLDFYPHGERLGSLVEFDHRHGEWHWIMRPQVAEALRRLGWVEKSPGHLPEEIAAVAGPLVEGEIYRSMVKSYERNPQARVRCIEIHGAKCVVCDFDFEAVYGEIGKGYIHVHHIRPLSEIGGEYVVDPVTDLRPVCPNCHAMLHRRNPAFGIEEVRLLLRSRELPIGTMEAPPKP